MAVPVEVINVRRAHDDDALLYGLEHDGVTRRLALLRGSGISVAAVLDDDRYPRAILLGLHGTKKLQEARSLLRFGDRDQASTAILRPSTIAKLRLPRSQDGPHWKNSAEFILNRPAGRVHVVASPPVFVVAKQSLEEMFCNPSLSVKLNSALNACFRNVCDFIKCTKTSVDCVDEAQQVRAFCFAEG